MKRKMIAALILVCMAMTLFAGCGIVQPGGNNMANQKESSQTAGEHTESKINSDTQDSSKQSNTQKTPQETTAVIAPGTDMSHSAELPLYTKVENEIYSGQTHWYSFTTGQEDEVNYAVVLVNTTPGDAEGDHTVQGMLMNEFGEELGGGYHYVYSDGKPETITLERAKANTTYYVGIKLENFNEDSGYTLVVKQK